jgi:hypothetical protein
MEDRLWKRSWLLVIRINCSDFVLWTALPFVVLDAWEATGRFDMQAVPSGPGSSPNPSLWVWTLSLTDPLTLSENWLETRSLVYRVNWKITDWSASFETSVGHEHCDFGAVSCRKTGFMRFPVRVCNRSRSCLWNDVQIATVSHHSNTLVYGGRWGEYKFVEVGIVGCETLGDLHVDIDVSEERAACCGYQWRRVEGALRRHRPERRIRWVWCRLTRCLSTWIHCWRQGRTCAHYRPADVFVTELWRMSHDGVRETGNSSKPCPRRHCIRCVADCLNAWVARSGVGYRLARHSVRDVSTATVSQVHLGVSSRNIK